MNGIDNTQGLLHEAEEKMHKEDEELNAKKAELKKLDDDNRATEAQIEQLEKKVTANNLHKKTVEMEIRHLMDRQRENHMRITRLAQQSAQGMQNQKGNSSGLRRYS
jgi:chromosome segregation ATPase